MSTHTRLFLMTSTAAAMLIGTSTFARAPDSRPAASRKLSQSTAQEKRGKHVLSGPYTHENLTVYLVHGEEGLEGRDFLTLEEALAQNEAKVYETGNVNTLAIENLNEDQEVFVQAGDIVAGGWQDRILGQDVIVPPKSGKIPLQSFCVELGRWEGRGAEPASHFARSGNTATSNSLKLAVRVDKDQRRVWQGVSETQARLSQNVGTVVNSPVSVNSLELALENKELQEKKKPYISELSGAIEGKDDVVGLVVILNRRIYSADVYASPRLFKKLWPKLLDAAATEAIANLNGRYAVHMPTEEDIQEFLATDSEPSRASDVLARYRIVEKLGKRKAAFELQDKEQPGSTIHLSVLAVGR